MAQVEVCGKRSAIHPSWAGGGLPRACNMWKRREEKWEKREEVGQPAKATGIRTENRDVIRFTVILGHLRTETVSFLHKALL